METHDSQPVSQPTAAGGQDPATTTRRQVILASFGALTFAFSLVGIFGGRAVANPQPGKLLPELIDPEPKVCEPPPGGDCDNTPLALGADNEDRDQSCSSTEADEGCWLTPSNSGNAAKDPDQHCAVSGDVDNACGDCNDAHDTDQSCGLAGSGGQRERDELCGHAHYELGHEDARCNVAGNADEGCGFHNTTYNYPPNWDDDDQACSCSEGGSDTDAHCSGGDSTCNARQPAYSTSPDESCNDSGDHDEACGAGHSVNEDRAYDQDQSCGGGEVDESCGAGGLWDGDDNCGVGGDPDND